MSRFDPPAPTLPQGLFGRTLTLPFAARGAYSAAVWPSLVLLLILELSDPGRTWRGFGSGPMAYRINDALFLVALMPFLLCWMENAPRLFDGTRLPVPWSASLRILTRARIVVGYLILATFYLTGAAAIQNATGMLNQLIGMVLGGAPPIGAAAWTADGLRLIHFALILWAGLALVGAIRDENGGFRTPSFALLPRCIMAALTLGILYELAGGTLIPILAEAISSYDVGAAQWTYRLFGLVLDLLLPAWAAAYIAVIDAALSRAEVSD